MPTGNALEMQRPPLAGGRSSHFWGWRRTRGHRLLSNRPARVRSPPPPPPGSLVRLAAADVAQMKQLRKQAQNKGNIAVSQLSLFRDITEPSTSVVGLEVTLPHSCRCGEANSVVGSSRGPHYASIVCGGCGAFRAWMSAQTFNFLSTVIDQFGRPLAPITVTMNSRSRVDSTATTTETER
jgi:hypothetical protein